LFIGYKAESGVLAALEEGKSEEEAFRLADSGAVASVVERAPGGRRNCFDAFSVN
jgi:hypothetical protein